MKLAIETQSKRPDLKWAETLPLVKMAWASS